MKNKNWIRVLGTICIVLMLIVMALQFSPFWSVDGQPVSIAKFVWFNTELPQLESYLAANHGDGYNTMYLAGWHCLIMAGTFGAVVFWLKNKDAVGASVCGILASLGCVIGYFRQSGFRLGANWILHVALASLALLAGISSIVTKYRKN